MAAEEVAVVVVEVEAGTFAVAPDFAAFALVLVRPAAVAHHLEAVLPHVPEIVTVDVALVHVAAHRGAAADGAVATYGGYVNARTALEEVVTNLLLIFAQEAFAGVADINDCLIVLLAALADKVEDATELLVGELQLGVVGGTAHGEDAEEAPGWYTSRHEVIFEFRQGGVVARVNTCDHVP